MDDEENEIEVHAPPPHTPPSSESESLDESEEDVEEKVEEDEDENELNEMFSKVKKLMNKMIPAPDNPDATVLHSLASFFETLESRYSETLESRYREKNDLSSSSNNRASNKYAVIGRFFKESYRLYRLVSSKFLSETRYTISVHAAAARFFVTYSATSDAAESLSELNPNFFTESLIENIKNWVMEDEESYLKHNPRRKEASDSEMLKTYSTRILLMWLASGDKVVEDVVTSNLPAMLMRYLRLRVLGETSGSQKDINPLTDENTSLRGTDDGNSRFCQVLESKHFDGTGMIDEILSNDQILEMNPDKSINGQICQEVSCIDRDPPDGLSGGAHICEVDIDGENTWNCSDEYGGGIKCGDPEESARGDLSRRHMNHGSAKSRGKGKVIEGNVECEPVRSSGSGSRLVQETTVRDMSTSENIDFRMVPISKKVDARMTSAANVLERDGNDACFQDCYIRSKKDISDLVRKAVEAAEAEARSANAPEEAVKAAGDAAAELVKTAASEEFKSHNDEEAAVSAASKVASAVIDSASAVEVSRNSISKNKETRNAGVQNINSGEEVEDYFIPDTQFLLQLREKYCIQCLQLLGKYVEVLSPVLHEKGVDVCLALLQQKSKHQEASKVDPLLPDVIKLICLLASHRKFAARFIDRGGMQMLLAVPRMSQIFSFLSSFLFFISSQQGIMERVCALSLNVIYCLVEMALQFLECNQDVARKDAALFFVTAFSFKAVLDAFDTQDGLQKLLGLLNDVALLRLGLHSGALGSSSFQSVLSSEVPTLSEQIASQTCAALRQYFRAHLLLLIDSIRPRKSCLSSNKNISSGREAYKPLDISKQAMDAVFVQLQIDQKLSPAFVRTCWPAVDKFLVCNGHITMLELCQAPRSPPVKRYLYDLLKSALGVLHIITLAPWSRRMIVNATLSNNRTGTAVILDAAAVNNHLDPEIIQHALNVLVNLVCPPHSISNNKSALFTQGQQSASVQALNGPLPDTRDRTTEWNISDQFVNISSQTDPREKNVEASATAVSAQTVNSPPVTHTLAATSGLVSVGTGEDCVGLAAQLVQGYHHAIEAVRAHNGIKVLLHLLQSHPYSSPADLDCLRALACRVLLGLAKDDTIAHILKTLKVGKKLLELIQDSGSKALGTEHGRWQAELSQTAMDLIGIVTNSRLASTLVATDAATPTLRGIEREAIAASTPITYDPRELLLLIHQHLQASGYSGVASELLKVAHLKPLPSFVTPSSLAEQPSTQVASPLHQWPCGRAPEFMSNRLKLITRKEDASTKVGLVFSSKKNPSTPSASCGSNSRHQPVDSRESSVRKLLDIGKESSEITTVLETSSELLVKHNIDVESHCKPPVILPMKRKTKDIGLLTSSEKRLNAGDQLTPNNKGNLQTDASGLSTPSSNLRYQQRHCTAGCMDKNQNSMPNLGQVIPSSPVVNDLQPKNPGHITLDSIMVQYLKHQHNQCPAPITTLPPLSLSHPHVCPHPKGRLDAPSNVTARLGTREFNFTYGGVHGNRRGRQFVYSRFRPWRTCRDDADGSLTCITILGDSSHIAVGTRNGEVKIFDYNNNVVQSCVGHGDPVTLVQSFVSDEDFLRMLLSSTSQDVVLWDASYDDTPILEALTQTFEGCKAAIFSNSGTHFAALASDSAQKEIQVYDIRPGQLTCKLSDTSTNFMGWDDVSSTIHFSPCDSMLLWNGVLWDQRISDPVHRFDLLTDYGGGGFHPSGNEVIMNSEVWDLRKFKLLHHVPSLDQTTITFNPRGDVIYAILRRNMEDDVTSAIHRNRLKHPLFTAFRTVDALNYSDIATIPVDCCVLDFAVDPTGSCVGVLTLDNPVEVYASGRIYEVGRRRPTEDDSDCYDAESDDEHKDESTFSGDSESVADDSSDSDDSLNEHVDDEHSDTDGDEYSDFETDDEEDEDEEEDDDDS